jgi:2-dehydro-3-deoxy-D-arabinonate dehydratase
MQYFQLEDGGECRQAVLRGSTFHDLTSAKRDLRTFGDLVRAADISDQSADDLAGTHLTAARELPAEYVREHTRLPVDVDEVWAAGVTYEISEAAREAESTLPEIYMDVYDAERPELFFKATSDRVVGPDDHVGIRGDSNWDVPEPELGLVLYRGNLVGYTVGNDVSSRSIEGENPLYLPQAKVYDRCCSLGPCVTSTAAVDDPHDLEMSMRIVRDDETVYRGRTSTGEMVRTCEELVSFYTRHNTPPTLAVLLTGTSLVPEEGFTLQVNDVVHIDVDGVGTLTNPVTVV